MADALREHFSERGPTPLYVVIGRGGLNLVRGMAVMRDTLAALALPYRTVPDRPVNFDPREVFIRELFERRGTFPEQALETAALTIFLYPRMLGCAAEVDDHMNRRRNMDTRTPASQCRFVA